MFFRQNKTWTKLETNLSTKHQYLNNSYPTQVRHTFKKSNKLNYIWKHLTQTPSNKILYLASVSMEKLVNLSILVTWAPKSARTMPAKGAGAKPAISKTLIPDNAIFHLNLERTSCGIKAWSKLDQLQVPTKVKHCQNFNCTDEKHLEEIENLYAELTSALLAAASSAIKITGKKNESKFSIPGWNSVVKSKHQMAKAAFRLWVNCNIPKTGGIYWNMTKTKKDFKYSLRQCRKDVGQWFIVSYDSANKQKHHKSHRMQ